MRRPRPRRLLPLAAGSALVLAACGGGDGGDDAVEVLPPAAAPAEADVDSDPVSVDPGQLLPTQVDLVGEAVQASSEIESNALPAVVLDDVTTGRKVNFRNLVPQDKPILLWMYAPH